MTIPARAANEKELPFQLRGSSFNIMVLKVLDIENASFYPQLANKTRQAPNFFLNAPIVLDLEAAPEMGVPELSAIVARLRQLNLLGVGVQNASPSTQKAAIAVGLAVMNPGQNTKEAPTSSAASPPQVQSKPQVEVRMPVAEASATPRTSLMITEPVRSGQQIYAAKGDLVVLAPVSPGAELLADGNIHVYGPLRGRALAGLGGDPAARIFCHSLEAELISVAGLYCLSEDIDKKLWKKNVQVFLKNGCLQVEVLG